jgi:ABC-type antimicrobial peptide transport system permease subunit
MSTMGVYMIVTYLTSRRAREVAVRRAIGAQSRDVVKVLAGQTLGWSFAGLAAGIAGSIAAANALRASVIGVTPLEPATVVSASALYIVIVAVAIAVPVMRTLRLDPAVVLRSE